MTSERPLEGTVIAAVVEQKIASDAFAQMHRDCATFLEEKGRRVKNRGLALASLAFYPLLMPVAKRYTGRAFFNPRDVADELSYETVLPMDEQKIRVTLTSDVHPTRSPIQLFVEGLDFSLKLSTKGAFIESVEPKRSRLQQFSLALSNASFPLQQWRKAGIGDVESWRKTIDAIINQAA